MNAQDEFVSFLQKYPECYSISKSGVMMRFLRAIAQAPKTVSELAQSASNVEELDVKLAVTALESAKLVKKAFNIQKEVYSLQEKGVEFLEKYDNAKNSIT